MNYTFQGVPNLRVSESERNKNKKQWYKDFINFHAPVSTINTYFAEDFTEKLRNYKLLNNDLNYDDWKPVCDNLGITSEAFENTLYTFNIIPKIVNELIGEELNRNEVFVPVLLTQKDIVRKEEGLKKNVSEYIDKVISATISYALQNLQLNGGKVEPQQAQAELERLRSEYKVPYVDSYMSEHEILANKILKYAQYKTNFKQIKNECFKDILIVDEEYAYVSVDNEPIIKRINPLFLMYHKSPEVKYVQDGDWALYTSPMTLFDIQKHYPEVTEKDWISAGINTHHDIGEYPSKNIKAFHHSQYPDLEQQFFSNAATYLDDINVGSYGTGNSTAVFRDRLFPVTHVVWKAFKWVGYLEYYDDYGDLVTDVIDDTFVVPKQAVKQKFINRWSRESTKYLWVDELTQRPYSLEWVEIPTVYEGTRIAGSIYVRLRELPYQNFNIENPFNQKLPYKGRVMSNTNARSISALERMKPYNVLYMLTLNKLIELIARYQGALIPIDVSQVDASMGDGDPTRALENTMKWKNMGYYLYNSLKDNESGDIVNTARPTPPVINADSSAAMMALIKILDWISIEIGMVIGVSPQRLAQMTAANVADNQQAIQQSSHITEPLFNMHNETWKEILTDYVNLFITWAKKTIRRFPDKKEHFLSYVLPDNSVETIKLTNDNLDLSDLGIFTNLSSSAKEYYQTMKEMSHALVQNEQMTSEDISNLLLGIMGGESPQEVHKKFLKAKLERDARVAEIEKERGRIQEQLQQQKAQTDMQILETQMRMKEFDRETSLMEIQLKGNIDKEVAAIKAYAFQDDLDTDKNNIPDPIEAAALQHKINYDNAKLELERSKVENDMRSQRFEEIKQLEQSSIKREELEIKRKQANKPKAK